MKTLKLKNYFFYSGGQPFTFQSFLNGLMLHGKESRERTRFVALITPRAQEIENERLKIAENNAKKNKKGEIIYLDKDNKETTDKSLGTQYTIEKQEAFTKELTDYLAEEFVIDVTPSNTDMIHTVKDIVLKTNKEFSGQEAVEYDEWCKVFEEMDKKV